MSDYDSVLTAAQQLPESERLRLINALWDSVPPEADVPLSDEWVHEIDTRVAELKSGRATTVPWSDIRDAALARVRDGKDD